MEKRIGYVCAFCGSSSVMMDAWASWDTRQQEWVSRDTSTEAFCRDCDGETSLTEAELISEPQP